MIKSQTWFFHFESNAYTVPDHVLPGNKQCVVLVSLSAMYKVIFLHLIVIECAV